MRSIIRLMMISFKWILIKKKEVYLVYVIAYYLNEIFFCLSMFSILKAYFINFSTKLFKINLYDKSFEKCFNH